MTTPELRLTLPDWVAEASAAAGALADDHARMRFVVRLARDNVLRSAGGPFAAAIVESASGRIIAAGVNLVVPLRSSIMHAEIVAILSAQQRLGPGAPSAPSLSACEMVTSCDPCAMCLGAVPWAGVRRLVCGADRADAERIGFDEGPVFDESYAYLTARGIEVVRGVEREEARAVLDLYAERNGVIYNG